MLEAAMRAWFWSRLEMQFRQLDSATRARWLVARGVRGGTRVTVQGFSDHWNGKGGTIIELREVSRFGARKPGALVRMDERGVEYDLTLDELRPE